MLVATHSRYVIDLNRPPDDANLYPGQDTTGLCPVDTFDRDAALLDGRACGDDEEIARAREPTGSPTTRSCAASSSACARAWHRVLWDAHSIRSVLPRFFEGKLPDLNFGTADGASCDTGAGGRGCRASRGGRGLHVGAQRPLQGRPHHPPLRRSPHGGVHAMQLEMTQCSYMDERLPFAYIAERAANVQPPLRAMLEAALEFAEDA